MKTTKLKAPRRVSIRGTTFWQVEAPSPMGGRIRKTFRQREDARIFHERAKVGLQRFGAAAMALDEKARADAIRALELLKPHGITLLDAARAAAAAAEARKGGRPLKDALTAFLAEKAGVGLSDQYQNDLRLRLTRFVNAHPKATTASISTAQITDFLRGLGLHAGTANTFRRDIATFFQWATDASLCRSNPAIKAIRFKAAPATPATITARELARMLESADEAIVPYLVLAAFCGLRKAEIARIDWRDINLSEGVVNVDATAAKTNARRAVTMPAAAVQWLMPLAKKAGPVYAVGHATRAAWCLARMAAGFGPFKSSLMIVRQVTAALTTAQRKALRPWPNNALRHSCISSRLALSAADCAAAFGIANDAALTITAIESVAFQSGNSPQVIRSNYLRLIAPSEARAWFAVTPPKPAENVVPMRRGA